MADFEAISTSWRDCSSAKGNKEERARRAACVAVFEHRWGHIRWLRLGRNRKGTAREDEAADRILAIAVDSGRAVG